MNRPSLLITVLMGALTVLLWALVNRPDVEPPWPEKIAGFSFSPMRGEQTPAQQHFPDIAQIDADLALLAGTADAVRTYTVESTLGEVPRLAGAHDLNVALGAWLNADVERNDAEIDRLIRVYKETYRDVVRVIVGNESLLRGELEVEQLIEYLRRVRRKVWAPISSAEPWHIWLKHPELVREVDFIAVHLLPYWENIPVDAAVDYVVSRYQELQRTYPGKPIVIAEVGWPSNGRTRGGAVASSANQAKFLRRFLEVAQREAYTYYIMEAFDQPWKHELEGEAGSHWGVYDVDREAKFAFALPVVQIPG
jgi:exo-beta-1,3-glucanase (GH17 family)